MALIDRPKTWGIIIWIVIMIIFLLIQIFFNYISYKMVSNTNEKVEEIHAIFYPRDKQVNIEIINE